LVEHIVVCGPADSKELFTYLNELENHFYPKCPGGTVVNELIKGLLDKKYRVTVVSHSKEIDYIWIFSYKLLTMYVVPCRKRPRDLALDLFKSERKLMSEVINRLEFDVVHAHWTYEFAAAALSCGRPVLVTAHDAPFTILKLMRDPYRFFRAILAYIVRFKIANLTVVSPYLLRKWRKEMFWSRSASVIPNISPYENKSDYKYVVEATKVLCISEDNKTKNLKALIESWPLVLEKVPNAQLDLIGFGLGNYDELKIWASSLELDKSITWHGYVHDRTEILGAILKTDIFISPSLEESFGMTFLESMANGIPVIGGINSGAVPYVVEGAGLLVDIRKPLEISNAIINLLQNQELRQKLGEQGKSRARSEFSRETITNSYLSEYNKLLRGSSV